MIASVVIKLISKPYIYKKLMLMIGKILACIICAAYMMRI
jgi:hypothetical protein